MTDAERELNKKYFTILKRMNIVQHSFFYMKKAIL